MRNANTPTNTETFRSTHQGPDIVSKTKTSGFGVLSGLGDLRGATFQRMSEGAQSAIALVQLAYKPEDLDSELGPKTGQQT